MARLTRRTALSGLLSLMAATAMEPAIAGQRAAELTIWGPPAGPSITLVHAIATGALRSVAERVDFKVWRSPDELRAGLTSKTMSVFVLPTQVAANLCNRGLGVRLVNVMTNGLLYVVSPDASITSMAGLKGRTLAVPFRNDTPDLLFRRLLAAHQLSPDADMTLRFTGTPIEAVQLLVTGRVDAALLPEPGASAAIIRAAVAGTPMTRVLDIQEIWGQATGLAPVLPQAGLGVTTTFLESHGPAVATLRDALVEVTASVNANPPRAAGDAAAVLELPWPVLEQSIAHSKLVAIRARDARPALEPMYRALAELDPAVIGGALPPPEFYL